MRKGVVHVEKWLCKGCGLCIRVCPVHALDYSDEVNEYGWRIPKQVGDCIACKMCERLCPDMAIWIEVKE